MALISYMTRFFEQFYVSVLSRVSIQINEAIKLAEVETNKELDLSKYDLKLTVVHTTKSKGLQRNVLYSEKNSFGKNKPLQEGDLADISRLRAQSNVQFDAE